jgi:hypothetical protein
MTFYSLSASARHFINSIHILQEHSSPLQSLPTERFQVDVFTVQYTRYMFVVKKEVLICNQFSIVSRYFHVAGYQLIENGWGLR